MIQLILGSLLLSVIHASIPNHWIPIVLIAKVEKWTRIETLWVAVISAFAHTLSTIALGVVIGLIGFKLSNTYETITHVVAPLILIFIGIIYFSLDIGHRHQEHFPDKKKLPKKSKLGIIVSLSTAMFFSPCLEIETYYFAAGTHGIIGIVTVSLIYLMVTVAGITLLVYLGYKSIEKFNWHFLEHHEKKITGSVLIILGIISYFITL